MESELIKKVMADEDLFIRIYDAWMRGDYKKIYFIRCNEFVKIGKCSSNVCLRLSDLQIGNPHELKIENIIHGDHELEQKLHRLLGKYWVRGEWFKIEKDELRKKIRDICKKK